MPAVQNLTLCVPRLRGKDNPHHALVVRSTIELDDLPENAILLRVDKFGFSANNITYQALGESPHFRYFDFHPAPKTDKTDPKTHGLIPVWGFAIVEKSRHPKINARERVYGYLAPSKYIVLQISPTDVNPHAFYVPRPHLPRDRRPYNQIRRCHADPEYDPAPEKEDSIMLYRPLFWTSFWCEDWLASSHNYRGADHVLISSASAKTAFTLTYLIRKRFQSQSSQTVRLVGLTSKRNVTFTRSLGLYDDVVEYGDLPSSNAVSPEGGKWLYVDVSGNSELNSAVSKHFATNPLLAKISLGATTLSPSASADRTSDLKENRSLSSAGPGITSGLDGLEMFFMPEWLNVRRRQLKVQDMTQMQLKAWQDFMRNSPSWVRMEKASGADEVLAAYSAVSKGRLGPEKGCVWSLWDDRRMGTRL